MRIALRFPATNNRGPQYMDQVLCALHQANPRRLPLRLHFLRHSGQVTLAMEFPQELRAVVESQLYAQYPECNITVLPDATVIPGEEQRTWEMDLHLHHDLFPIRRYPQFEDALNRVSADPLAALFMSVADACGKTLLDARIEIELRPASALVRWRAGRCLRRLAGPFFRQHHHLGRLYAAWALSGRLPLRMAAAIIGRLERSGAEHQENLTTTPSRLHDREEELQAAADKLGRLLFHANVRLRVSGHATGEAVAREKLREIAGAFGQFSSPRLASFRAKRAGRGRPAPFLLSTEEVATLWHLPTHVVRAPTMTTVESRELPPPTNLPTPAGHPDLAVLGRTLHRGQVQRFGILLDDRRRHVALVGKTGQGKTTLIQQLIVSDVRAGRGVALLDPHGDLCEAMLASIPRERTNDVILFDAADPYHPVSFNPLFCPRPGMRTLVASGILSAFKKLYADFWGPRMEHILRNALLALLETPDATLVSLLRFLSDGHHRRAVTATIADPLVRSFWEREFAGWPVKFQVEAVAPVQNKLGHFLSSPLLRNILGQRGRGLDLRAAMDDGRILLCNLSKGRLGDDASALLGSFLVTSVQLAAMSRADQAETDRRDFFLYVDEFQNFATES
ncbi:MAG: DUF87 domain-containing protein, partial [Planctomycetes bacterium]|nr:DUF87 domain-containing protein [Planctomycetota bacterium]